MYFFGNTLGNKKNNITTNEQLNINTNNNKNDENNNLDNIKDFSITNEVIKLIIWLIISIFLYLTERGFSIAYLLSFVPVIGIIIFIPLFCIIKNIYIILKKIINKKYQKGNNNELETKFLKAKYNFIKKIIINIILITIV
jgi:hypothetical protein